MRRFFLIIGILLAWAIPSRAAISEITAAECSASTTTCTIGTVQVGDFAIAAAYNSAAATAPTNPSGWTVINSSTGNTNALKVACAVATSTSITMGTWTNATRVGVIVLRGVNAGTTANCVHVITNNAATNGAFATGGTSSNSIAYNTFTLNELNSTSWVVGIAGHRTATNLAAPSGMTAQQTINTGPSFIMSDTQGGVNTWSTTSTGVNATSGWRSLTFEVKAPCADFMCADAFVDMIGTAAGTTVSATNLATGTQNNGYVGTWSVTTPTGLTFHATQSGNRKCSVTIENTNTAYATSHASQALALDDTQTNPIMDLGNSGTTWFNATVAFFLTYGPASTSNAVWDIVRLQTTAGHLSIVQMDTTGGTNGLRIENDSTTTADINLTQGHKYWVSFASMYDDSLATLHVYDPSNNWAEVSGSPKSLAISHASFPDITDIILGNDGGSGTSSDTTFFENILVDVTLGQNPLGPGSCSASTLPPNQFPRSQ